MEPFDYPDNDPGPHTLNVAAKPQENIDRLHWADEPLRGLYRARQLHGREIHRGRGGARPDPARDRRSRPRLSRRRLVAAFARRQGWIRRQDRNGSGRVVLDGAPRAEAIDRELSRLEAIARERGFAIGSASALPVTVERIARWARTLEERGILLVPVSAAFRQRGRAMNRHRGSADAGVGELPYRPCVGVMLLNHEGLVFLGRRRSEAGPEHVGGGYAWQMPQGGIDPGEDPYRAALRELYEETNVRSVGAARRGAGLVRLRSAAPSSPAAPGKGGIAGRRRDGSRSASRATTARSTSASRAAAAQARVRRVALGAHGARLPI